MFQRIEASNTTVQSQSLRSNYLETLLIENQTD
jgi:hypothetical protein